MVSTGAIGGVANFPFALGLNHVNFSQLVRWCNGSTLPFGGICHGSNPCRTASLPAEINGSTESRTDSAQKTAESETQKLRFPITVKHRKAEARICGKTKAYPFYRVCAYVAGKRKMSHFATYSEAKAKADKLVREIADGSQVAALNAHQSHDALAALERLESFRQSSGKRVSLLGAVSEFVEAAGKLNGRSLGDAVDGYLNTVASVKRKDIAEAVEDFVAGRQPKTRSLDGKRAQLSAGYAYQVGLWLRDFAKTFPGTAVADLTKEHLNLFMAKFAEQSGKSRNHYRQTVKMFLRWAVKRDYLSPSHRLLEADGMAAELSDAPETEIYSPIELRALLEAADKELRPVLALQALGGVRLQECLRLTWQDVWRVPGHIEVLSAKSKTRSRRLCERGEALGQWLEPYREHSGQVFAKHRDTFHESLSSLLKTLRIPAKRNGLRHGFCTYHFALYANENLTAAQAGNSPAMIPASYKGLATKAEAEKWFAVAPLQSAENVIPLSIRKP